MAETKFMYVKSGAPGRVGMAETDEQHPGGSVMVGDQCRKVAKTPFAMYQQRDGMLVECNGTKDKAAADKFAAAAVKSNPRPDSTPVEEEDPGDDAPSTGDANVGGDDDDKKDGK